jgi:hypothetical protein
MKRWPAPEHCRRLADVVAQVPRELWVLIVATAIDAAWSSGLQCRVMLRASLVCRQWRHFITVSGECMPLLQRLDWSFLYHWVVAPSRRLPPVQPRQIHSVFYGAPMLTDRGGFESAVRDYIYRLPGLTALKVANMPTRIEPLAWTRLPTTLCRLSTTVGINDAGALGEHLRELDLSSAWGYISNHCLVQMTSLRALSLCDASERTGATLARLTALERLELRGLSHTLQQRRDGGCCAFFGTLTALTCLQELTLSRRDFAAVAPHKLERDIKAWLPSVKSVALVNMNEPCRLFTSWAL